jgi:hypothetical protein
MNQQIRKTSDLRRIVSSLEALPKNIKERCYLLFCWANKKIAASSATCGVKASRGPSASSCRTRTGTLSRRPAATPRRTVSPWLRTPPTLGARGTRPQTLNPPSRSYVANGSSTTSTNPSASPLKYGLCLQRLPPLLHRRRRRAPWATATPASRNAVAAFSFSFTLNWEPELFYSGFRIK